MSEQDGDSEARRLIGPTVERSIVEILALQRALYVAIGSAALLSEHYPPAREVLAALKPIARRFREQSRKDVAIYD